MNFYKIIGKLSQYATPVLCFFISLWALYLRLQRFSGRKLWNDECYQLSFMTGPFQPFWERRIYGDFTCFPGDYLLNYPFLRIFGLHKVTQPFSPMTSFDKWALIVPHILVTILGFYLLYLVCRRHLKTIYGYLIVFSVVGFNWQLIFHSLEFRPYAVLPTLALGVFYFVDIIINRGMQLSILKKGLIGAFFVFTILFHQYGILIVFFILLYFLLSKAKEGYFQTEIKSAVKYFSAIFIIALPPWLWYSLGSPDMGDIVRPTFEYFPNPLDTVAFLKSVFGNLIGRKELYFLLAGMIAAFMIPHKARYRQIGFFLILVILPIELVCVVDVYKKYWFLQRQFVWVMPLFAFLLGWCWDVLIFSLQERFKNAFALSRRR